MLSVVSNVTESSIVDDIERAAIQTSFVIVDLEGTASMTVAYAISRADLVIIPTQGSQLDAVEAAKAIKLIRQQEKAFGRTILFAILFTRTSAAIRPRTLAHIEGQFQEHQIAIFNAQIHEREAYRAIFSFGGTLSTLDKRQVSNLASARMNALAFTGEVIEKLRVGAKTTGTAT